ncbi:MAG: hypothetical protein JWM56_807 [Candidatus Peribacteria bacterium]|nr:hypothetical protein [Candidatus Peribacteria bacterium]
MYRLLFLIGIVPGVAHAAFLDSIGTSAPGISAMWAQLKATFPFTGSGNGVVIITSKIASFVLFIIATVAVLALMYAGFQMVTAAGEESKLGDAKKTATYAILGVILASIAELAVAYVAKLVTAAVGG